MLPNGHSACAAIIVWFTPHTEAESAWGSDFFWRIMVHDALARSSIIVRTHHACLLNLFKDARMCEASLRTLSGQSSERR